MPSVRGAGRSWSLRAAHLAAGQLMGGTLHWRKWPGLSMGSTLTEDFLLLVFYLEFVMLSRSKISISVVTCLSG